jgi:hypothetical protein
MATSYQKNKKHIYNWVAKNPDKYKELTKNRMRRYREKLFWKAIFAKVLKELKNERP